MKPTGNIPFFGIWYEAWTACLRAHRISETPSEEELCSQYSQTSVHYPGDVGDRNRKIEEIREGIARAEHERDEAIRAAIIRGGGDKAVARR